MVPRPLGDLPLGWELDPAAVTDYGKTAAETGCRRSSRFRLAFWGERCAARRPPATWPTRATPHGPTHFVAHAVIQQVRADR